MDQDLPAELWRMIGSSLSQASLLSVSRISRRIHDILSPELYRNVRFLCPGSCNPGPEISSLEGVTTIGPRTSKISKPTALKRTLKKSTWACSMIQGVELTWHDKGHDKCMYRILKALASSPLQNLRISPAHFNFKIPPGTSITSFRMHLANLTSAENLKRLDDLSFTPSLRHICLDHCEFAHEAVNNASSDDVLAKHKTNVTQLSFFDTEVPAGALHSIVKSPKSLRTLSYCIWYRMGMPHSLPKIDFYGILSNQQQCLEEITLSFHGYKRNYLCARAPIPFNDFPVLKRLRINLEFLGVIPRDLFKPSDSVNDCKIHQSLPRSLEELQLELQRHGWRNSLHRPRNPRVHFSRGAEFLDHIQELANSLSQHLPALKFVGLSGRPTSWAWGVEGEAKRMFDEAGVNFYYYFRSSRRAFRT